MDTSQVDAIKRLNAEVKLINQELARRTGAQEQARLSFEQGQAQYFQKYGVRLTPETLQAEWDSVYGTLVASATQLQQRVTEVKAGLAAPQGVSSAGVNMAAPTPAPAPVPAPVPVPVDAPEPVSVVAPTPISAPAIATSGFVSSRFGGVDDKAVSSNSVADETVLWGNAVPVDMTKGGQPRVSNLFGS